MVFSPNNQNNFDWIVGPENSKSRCADEREYLIHKDSWSLYIEEYSLDYDDKSDKLILEGQHLSYLHSDHLCKPTLKETYFVVWFPEEMCSNFHISDFVGQMSKVNSRYWFETDDFSKTTGKRTWKKLKACCQLHFLVPIQHWKLLLGNLSIL